MKLLGVGAVKNLGPESESTTGDGLQVVIRTAARAAAEQEDLGAYAALEGRVLAQVRGVDKRQ